MQWHGSGKVAIHKQHKISDTLPPTYQKLLKLVEILRSSDKTKMHNNMPEYAWKHFLVAILRYLFKVKHCFWSFYFFNEPTHAGRVTRSSAVAERPRDAACHWIFRCHSRSLKVIRNDTTWLGRSLYVFIARVTMSVSRTVFEIFSVK